MFRIAICENSIQHIETVLTLISKYKAIRPGLEIQIHSFRFGKDLLNDWNGGKEYDLFLFEILIPDMSGIELAKELRLRGEEAPLVFLASSTDYAFDAFRVHATQYILKPVKEEYFFSVLDKISSTHGRKENNRLLFSTPERTLKIPFFSIACVESINRTLRIHLADGTKIESKILRVPFAEALAPLLRDSRFLHAHNSYVLNMDCVEEISGKSFVMKGGAEVPVPKYKYTNAKARYLNYISTKWADSPNSQKCRTLISVTM